MIHHMKQKKTIKYLALALLLLLLCGMTAACGKTKKAADLSSFCSACENDGLTASSHEAEDPAGEITEYAAYDHGLDNVLVEYYRFDSEDIARQWYQTSCENVTAGPSTTKYEMAGNNFTSLTVTADRAYTIVTQVEDTLVIATGPQTYKSALDRIMLSIGYLTSNL